MNDLETIANLELARAVERISAETHEKMQHALAGMPRGGQMEHAKLKIQLDQAAESCHAYAQIWLDLIEAKNEGLLTRENVGFIARKIREFAAARKASLISSPNPPRLAYAADEIARRMDGVAGSIRRDLEIRIRKQEALPQKRAMDNNPHITVTPYNTPNRNLRPHTTKSQQFSKDSVKPYCKMCESRMRRSRKPCK
jgi:hypothetical protein